MNALRSVREFALFFALTFVVTAAVSFLWSLVAHGSGIVDWGSAVRLGIILGVVLAWRHAREPRTPS